MTKPTQLMPELLILREIADDFSHAPTTRAAIDKERIEELEAEVARLTYRIAEQKLRLEVHVRDEAALRAALIKETPPSNDGPENLVKPGFDIEPTRTE